MGQLELRPGEQLAVGALLGEGDAAQCLLVEYVQVAGLVADVIAVDGRLLDGVGVFLACLVVHGKHVFFVAVLPSAGVGLGPGVFRLHGDLRLLAVRGAPIQGQLDRRGIGDDAVLEGLPFLGAAYVGGDHFVDQIDGKGGLAFAGIAAVFILVVVGVVRVDFVIRSQILFNHAVLVGVARCVVTGQVFESGFLVLAVIAADGDGDGLGASGLLHVNPVGAIGAALEREGDGPHVSVAGAGSEGVGKVPIPDLRCCQHQAVNHSVGDSGRRAGLRAVGGAGGLVVQVHTAFGKGVAAIIVDGGIELLVAQSGFDDAIRKHDDVTVDFACGRQVFEGVGPAVA